MMKKEERENAVLVMRLSALGDVAMSLPEVYDVCLSNPDRQFIFLTRKLPAQLFVNHPQNLTPIGEDFSKYKGVAGLRRLFSKLAGEYDIDTVVDLHDVLRTKILRLFFRLSGARTYHIDKGRAEKRRLTRRHNKVILPLRPTPERYHEVFAEAHLFSRPLFTTLFPGGKGPAAAFARISQPRKEGERWLAIAPFAAHDGKIYPLELMEKVIEYFSRRPGLKIFLFGGGARETEILGQLAERYGAVNVAGAGLGLASELALLSHCDAMLSMDSSNMHLASLVGLPVVSVWGATHPYAGFMGRGQDPQLAVQLDMVCRPCSVFGDKPCFRGDYNCLRGIPPAHIISRLTPFLN